MVSKQVKQAHGTIQSCGKIFLMTLGGGRLALPSDYQYLS